MHVKNFQTGFAFPVSGVGTLLTHRDNWKIIYETKACISPASNSPGNRFLYKGNMLLLYKS